MADTNAEVVIVDDKKVLIIQTSVFREKCSAVIGLLESQQVDVVHIMRRKKIAAVLALPEQTVKKMNVGPIKI